MSATTQPVFIVGTGRCGTRALYKMLLGTPGVEVHHEYLCTHVQQIAALWSMRELPMEEIATALDSLYAVALYYSEAATWIDSSNKVSWLILPLSRQLPRAKFVVVYRDGRKVTSSFLHKLTDECYDDRSTKTLLAWLDGSGDPIPPPEKRYWWNVPRPGQPFWSEFPRFNQFQRICYHWQTCNAEIKRQLALLPADAFAEFKLEELVSDPAQVERLARFIGIEPKPEHFAALQRPEGVIVPQDFGMTVEQEAQFWAICRPMMEVLGYDDKPSYRVNYHP
jgi:hypothetical protein